MQEFSFRTRIFFGEGALEGLRRVKNRRVLIVTDRFMVEAGVPDKLTGYLEGCQVSVFADVKPDPPVEVVAQGVAALRESGAQVMIAVGGGSVIDAAKIIRAAAYAMPEGQRQEVEECYAIPTTSGTGSEVSRFAVITDREKGVKYPLIDDSLLPDVAILDAQLTASVPPAVTADTGLDVFTHAVEAFVCTAANDFTDAAAEKSIKLVRRHLLNAYQHPDDLKARQGMHNASCLAGVAFSNAGLGLNHGMAHALGARFHIPHGRANGILLPYVMSFNAGCSETLTPTAKRYAQISRLLGLESSSVRQSALNLIRTARRYVEKLNVPSTIQAAGVNAAEFEAAVDEMAQAAVADRCTATNPRACTVEEVAQLYRKAYTGKLP